MQFVALRKTFDRCDLIACVHDRKTETGINPAPVHEDGARAALTVIAALLRTGELQMFAQCVEEARAWVEVKRQLSAVDLELERSGFRRGAGGRRDIRGSGRFGGAEPHQSRSKGDRRAGAGDLF